jgi:hypothetical protein
MRRTGIKLAAFALAAGGALAATLGASAPASAGGGLVTIYAGDIASDNVVQPHVNIAPTVAAVVCGIDVDVITSEVLTKGGKTDCKLLTRSTGKQHWVAK